MKTKLIVEIETNNMNKIYNDSNTEQFTPENEITEAMEEQIHQAIVQVIKCNLTEEILQETLLNNCIPEFEFMGVDEWNELSDYGNIKVTLENENTQEKDILSNFINNTPYDNVQVSKQDKKEIKQAVKTEENTSDEEDF